MKKIIWYFHHYASQPSLTGLTRPYNFGQVLKDKGYHIIVFAASYLHFSNENLIKDKKPFIVLEDNGVTFVYIKTPDYLGNGISRVKNMLVYYKNIFEVTKRFAKENGEPDIIIGSSPHPLAMVAGIKIAKIRNIPCICEVRDLWPEEIFLIGKSSEKSIIGRLMIAGENWIYKKADAIIFTKEGHTDYLKERGWDSEHGGNININKCWYINNGVNLNDYEKSLEQFILDDPDLHKQIFNIVYTGAIRTSNNVGNILDCAVLLKEHSDIQFLIYGGGDELDAIKKRVQNEKLTNVKIKGYVNRRFIPYILNHASVNILNYSNNLVNWSRGDSSNKLFEYLASGKPIISNVKMGYCLIERYKCGLTIDENTPKALADAILNIKNMNKNEYDQMSNNALIGVKEFDFNVLSNKLIQLINSLEKI